MAEEAKAYVPPKVWKHKPGPGIWGKLNQPTAGPRSEKELPRGKHAIQLYSMATPNGIKAGIFLEELYEAYGLEYDAWLIHIAQGQQFTSGFVKVNPNSKIPALLVYDLTDEKKPPVRVFESASILLYIAENFDKDNKFLPKDPQGRIETISWLFWQIGSSPYLGGGGFGAFFGAKQKVEFAIDKYALEVKRQFDVLERVLAGKDGSKGGPFLLGEQYTIADICIWAWYGRKILDIESDQAVFLDLKAYPHVLAWAKKIAERPAVVRGQRVNKVWGPESEQVVERHSAADFTKTKSKEEEPAKK